MKMLLQNYLICLKLLIWTKNNKSLLLIGINDGFKIRCNDGVKLSDKTRSV